MKMKTLLLVLFLEFHSSPLTSANYIPEHSTEDSDIHDVEEEGFLIHHLHRTTESPKRNTTTKASLRSLFESINEGSGDIMLTSVPESEHTTVTVQTMSESQPEGSGDDVPLTTTMSILEGSGDMSTNADATLRFMDHESEVKVVLSKSGRSMAEKPSFPIPDDPSSTPIASHVGDSEQKETPSKDPIFIIGIVACVAAVAVVGAVIATKKKWYKAKHVFKQESKSMISNPVKELEMQTFLHKEEPKQDEKESEYTVIPLEDLSEKL